PFPVSADAAPGPYLPIGDTVTWTYAITNDGNTLYFSSTGHLGLGEQDIFMTKFDPIEGWSFPTNLGIPVNSSYRELGFFELLTASSEAAPLTVVQDEDGARTELDALGEKTVSVFAVFEGPSPPQGTFVGLAVHSPDSGRDLYFTAAALKAVEDWLAKPLPPKVGHEVAAMLAGFAKEGLRIEGLIADTACASHLLEPSNHAPHDLELLARLVLRRSLTAEAADAGRFAAEQARAVGDLWQSLGPRVSSDDMKAYLQLSETVAKMAARGIAVNREVLAQVGRDFEKTEQELEQQVHALADRRFNLGSVKQLGAVLFEDLSLPVHRRTKTGWSTSTEALERIRHEHPIVPPIIEWRALKRLRSTWITAFAEHIDNDGRVHSTFHVARSFSGRIINAVPDLGRVPGRTPQMQRIRSAFVAPAGTRLLSLDYKQLGLHVLAHLSRDPALVGPLGRGDDMHRLTASAVLEIPAEALNADQRQLGKLVNFATFAGQGASALAQQLSMTAQEAKALIDRFDERYRGVRAFQETQLELARSRGYIVTIAGRKWPIGDLESLDPQIRGYAERLARRAT
ncbi:MAG: DNA polymerase, partial [Myxococcota bacterium]